MTVLPPSHHLQPTRNCVPVRRLAPSHLLRRPTAPFAPVRSAFPQHVRLFVRIYRDYSIADFVFVTLATLGVSYTTFSSPYIRSTACEVLSRHPELMRDMGEMGLSLENCEQWFERAVVAVLGIMFILIVVRVSRRSHPSCARRVGACVLARHCVRMRVWCLFGRGA